MGSFKDFLNENESLLQDIYAVLDELGLDEIAEFGEFLYNEFFDGDWDYSDEESEDADFCIDEVKEMIAELGPDMYSDILDLLQPDELDLDDDLDEAVSRRMKTSDMNKNKRKYMNLSKSKYRQGKAERKKAARKNKAAAKRYYRANKKKIQAYQKSRSAAIKSGKHKVKVRKG